MNKVWVLIPAFNEESGLKNIIPKIKEEGCKVLVIDDGSSDNTYSAAVQLKADVVLRNVSNLGKGACLIKGFEYLLSSSVECEYIIIMDADGQHNPLDIGKFVEKLKQGYYLVIGNRLSNSKEMPFIRLVVNKVMSWVIFLRTGKFIPDTQCGFKGLKLDVVRDIRFSSRRFEIDSEIIIKSLKKGFKAGVVDIESIYRKETSAIRPFKDTLRFLRFIIAVK